MAEQLTYAQDLAVRNRGGKLLVSAAAGSGKTKVLVERLLMYMTDPVAPANIDDFLIITYTKAAAAELRGKIAAKLSQYIAEDPDNRHLQRQMQRLYLTKISTVHAFCTDILREYAYMLDVPPDFRVGDETECMHLRNRAMDAVLEDAYSNLDSNADFLAFVDTQGLGRTDALVPEIIEQVYDSAMCHLNPGEWLEHCITDADVGEADDPLDTQWGRYLADTLFACVDGYIAAMEACCARLGTMEGMEKPLCLLNSIVAQLRQLRSAQSWDAILENKNIDYGRLVFPKKFDDPNITDRIKAVRKACKDTLDKKLRWFSDPADRVLGDLKQSLPAARGLVALVKQFSQKYNHMKKAARILDFSDLEQRTLDLLWGKHRTGITAVAREIGERFREIMVDEYQDSNSVQDAVFEALTNRKQNQFLVGDVKQSIYQFRLADPDIFLEKYAAFVDAEEASTGEGRKILLSSNFRSGGGVIDAVNDVFRDCMSETVGGLAYGDDEALREGIEHSGLGETEVELHAIAAREDTYPEEAAYVADRIESLLDGSHFIRDGKNLRPICPDDIVILLRSPGSVGGVYQQALEQKGISCAGIGGADLLMSEEVGTLRSLLQIISNPRQDIPLVAVLASPVFALTADELACMRGKNKHCSMYDAVLRSDLPKAKTFLQTLSELRKGAAMLNLPELLELVFRVTQLDTVYTAMADGEFRKKNLQSFYQLAADFSSLGACRLESFLEHLDALDERGVPIAAEQPAGCVTIMSIHKSKGLEFPVVFLCGLSKRFNREDLKQQVLCHKDLGLGLSCIDRKNRIRYPTLSKHTIGARLMAENVSEEMRVLYVAMTRAKDRLIMTYTSQYLEKDVRDIALTMDLCDRTLMTADVSCPGKWILYSALKRTEAGELFALGGNPEQTRVATRPWKIVVTQAPDPEKSTAVKTQQTETAVQIDMMHLKQLLGFHYPYEAATRTPSKQTATQIKGRQKDREIIQDAEEPKPIWRSWRSAAFEKAKTDGTGYGNAVHTVMQHIRYEACASVAGIQAEVQRMVEEGFLAPEHAALINCEKLAAFFASEFGNKLIKGCKAVREFKFSILDDATRYGENLKGEYVLLQGVVDCALVEEDGISIVDFKTDHTTEQFLNQIRDRYTAQIETYAAALSRIFRKPVKLKALYLFSTGEFLYLP